MTIPTEEIIKRVRDLPSLSAVVVELMETMEQEDIDLHALASKIALDQALTAKTLRLANSSFYGMSAKVTTIHQAIAVLGFHSIRTLVTACSISASFDGSAAGNFDFQAFWRHSVATAVCAKLLARHLQLNPDSAFTAGLLHDIGSLVLATRYTGQYQEMLAYRAAHDCYLVDAERAVFGLDHAAVGSALAGWWKFPAAMQDAVAAHHQDRHAGPPSLALVVHAANTLAHGLDLSGVADDLAPPISVAAWDALALDEASALRLFREAEATFGEMCQILLTGG